MVTVEYLSLQAENIKKSLVIQTIGVVFSGMVLLGWFINYLDNKTRDYVNARFDSQDARFDKIESDLKDIKNFIFSLSAPKNIKEPKNGD